jgi:hypothetical protein
VVRLGFPFCKDDDLAPAFRLHYIPLSTSYAEIYNIHAFFSGGTSDALVAVNSTVQGVPRVQRVPLDGDRRLRRIARAGKNWKNTIGRQVDMEGEPACLCHRFYAANPSYLLPAYVYRLCLEYARLAADNRDTMDFKF